MSYRPNLLFILLFFISLNLHAQYAFLAKTESYSLYEKFRIKASNINAESYWATHSIGALGIAIDGNDNVTCSNWLKIQDEYAAFQIGDLDVPGQTITVEALFNRTAISPIYTDSAIHGKGEIVSKHSDPTDANYILRADRAQVTTTNGHFVAAADCDLPLNKTYHVALVYDGKILKFYRNGFLLASTPCTGNLITNNLQALVGNYAYVPGMYNDALKGFINEVRIWNVARTQSEIRTYMNASIPSPKAQSGLLAYYTFDDLKNKQGNSLWDGKLIGNAQLNQTNPTCNSFIADSCNKVVLPSQVIASFSIPDTVCLNTPVHITNTTTDASSYYWSFCTADLKNTIPEAFNLGNTGGALSEPVFMDLVSENGKYYAFVTNHEPGGLVRLDFGNSYLNTPVATSFGNLGVLPPGFGTEGVQVVKNKGKWYAFIVAGSPQFNIPSRLVKVELGASIENASPTATDWGNIGNMSLPIDFYMFQDNDEWYGFTVNAFDNTITRFSFTNSFDNVPTGTNLGNVGNLLNYPTGVHAVNNGGNWSLFVTNAISNELIRLDFGASLLNVPTAKDLGNLNNTMKSPRDVTILNSCESAVGYIVNGEGNDIVQLDFNNDLNSIPTGKSLGNIGNLYFPHSISKLFRVDNDVYSFITNVNNSTITRLRFAGCTNANISGSALQNPPDIVYDKPGTYNISLSVDEGLATQSSTCRQVVVIAPPEPHSTVDTSYCGSGSIKLVSLSTGNNFLWNTGATTNSIDVSASGKYWVTTDAYGCQSTDSFKVTITNSLTVSLGNDTTLCKGDSLIVVAKGKGSTYVWQDGSTNDSLKVVRDGIYSIIASNSDGCIAKDTINVTSLESPVLSGTENKTICINDVAQLSVTASGDNNTYTWQPNTTLSSFDINNPIASPKDTTTYYLAVTNENGCIAKDSVHVNVVARPDIKVRADTAVCNGDKVLLTTSAINATAFSWSPAQSLNNNTVLSPLAAPVATTKYSVAASNDGCSTTDDVIIQVNQLPVVHASNDTTICGSVSAKLSVTGAKDYVWFPVAGLNDPSVSNPVTSPSQTTMYHVIGTDRNGCVDKDSVQITVGPLPQFTISPVKDEVCLGDSIMVTSSGGDIYTWSLSPDVLTPNQASTYIKPSADGIYKVVVNNSFCNVSDTLFTTLSIAQKPIIHVSRSNDIDCTVNTTTLLATGANHYEWTPIPTLTNPHSASTLAMPGQTTVYYVKAASYNGCISEDSVRVEVKIANKENAYLMASAFTPNNDGVNDCFGVKKWSLVDNLDFTIYDRWGSLVFHGTKASDCWDGTRNGLPQAAGAFIYVIKATTICGNIYKKGTVVLVR